MNSSAVWAPNQRAPRSFQRGQFVVGPPPTETALPGARPAASTRSTSWISPGRRGRPGRAHRLRQVGRPDVQHVDALDGGDFLDFSTAVTLSIIASTIVWALAWVTYSSVGNAP